MVINTRSGDVLESEYDENTIGWLESDIREAIESLVRSIIKLKAIEHEINSNRQSEQCN